MPVDTTHHEYEEFAPLWEKLRDVLGGEEKIKAKGEKYLPKPSAHDYDDYRHYVRRAHFYEATGRTKIGLLGALFRKPPQATVPPAFEPLLESITDEGDKLPALARDVSAEVLTVGRYGLLADMPEQASAAYLTCYPAESITNWREERIGGSKVPVSICLKEGYQTSGKDEWEIEENPRYRVLELAPDGAGGELIYRQRIFEKVKTGTREDWVQIGPPIYPKRRGRGFWTEIPFVPIGPASLSLRVEMPPLLALCNANLAHYLVDADIAWGLYFTALPTPWVAGGNLAGKVEVYQGEGGEWLSRPKPGVRLGSTAAWDLPGEARVGMLEFSGAGIDAYQGRQRSIEARMVHLGAQLLADQKREAETAEAMRLRSAGETAVLSVIAQTVSQGISKGLALLAEFEGIPDEGITVRLNTDFFENRMGPAELKELVASWQSGALTTEALAYNLTQGELLPPGTDPLAYAREIAPAPTVPPDPARDEGDDEEIA